MSGLSRILAVLAAVLSLLSGCREPHASHDPTLQRIVSRMDSTEWDYPCPEIMGVPLSDMTTPGDTALHRLLMFSHLKRSNVHVPQDSLIGDAAEWFAAHPEPRLCMMA